MTATRNGTAAARPLAYWKRESRKYLTTGQVAVFCEVAPRTASKWFDSGRLRGYRIPDSEDRRFDPAGVLRLLIDRGMPVPPQLAALAGVCEVLVVGDHDLAADLAALSESAIGPGWAVADAPTEFDAGRLVGRVWPRAAVVVVAGAERAAMLRTAARLREQPWAGGAAWVLVDTEDRAGLDALDHGFDVVLFGEVGAGVVAECVRRATAGEGAA
jgi:two-component system, OmpR family, response regulator RpaA